MDETFNLIINNDNYYFSHLPDTYICGLSNMLTLSVSSIRSTLPQEEENLIISVHAYPVITDLHIPPRIDLLAVPFGQRCVYTVASCLPERWPVALGSSVPLAVLPFTPVLNQACSKKENIWNTDTAISLCLQCLSRDPSEVRLSHRLWVSGVHHGARQGLFCASPDR